MAKAGEAGVKLAVRLLLKREKFAKFRKMLLARRVWMSDEVRIGSLRLKFLIDDAENGGKLTMFDMTVPEQAKVPAAHYHRDFEEV